MNFIENIILSVKTLLSNRIRSLLAVLGVIIGTIAVISLVALGEAAKAEVKNQAMNVGRGTNFINVQPFQETGLIGVFNFFQSYQGTTFSEADVDRIRKNCPHVSYVDPRIYRSGTIAYSRKRVSIPMIIGVGEHFDKVETRKIQKGRFFRAEDVKQRRRVIIIGSSVAKELLGEVNPIGERVRYLGTNFEVVGILEEKGALLDYDLDNVAFIPVTSAQELFGIKGYSEISAAVRNESDVPAAKEEIERAIIPFHPGKEIRVTTQEENISFLQDIMNVFSMLIVGISAISLVVAGVGIMNIMLVSVSERIREIGIRKAIGARKRDIFRHFLAESLLLSIFGGIIGILVGGGFSFVMLNRIGMEYQINLFIIFIVFSVSCVVGVISGVYPAIKASELDPIVALRYE
jgi:putative ABC transport system permease protein